MAGRPLCADLPRSAAALKGAREALAGGRARRSRDAELPRASSRTDRRCCVLSRHVARSAPMPDRFNPHRDQRGEAPAPNRDVADDPPSAGRQTRRRLPRAADRLALDAGFMWMALQVARGCLGAKFLSPLASRRGGLRTPEPTLAS